jgi:uncharacterized protein YdeI (YjbR/CyaY-like superfamily)
MDNMDLTFFESPAAFRVWLEEHHARASEVWVGFYKKGAGKAGITYAEALDEALCFGWIDGVRRSLDESSYTNRFSPRKPRSVWSLVNIRRAEELARRGRMAPAGLQAFAARDEERARQYSYEARTRQLDDGSEQDFRVHPHAWAFFQAQPPGYQRTATWWVMSAKKDETRRKRLATLIEESAQGRRLAWLSRPTNAAKP